MTLPYGTPIRTEDANRLCVQALEIDLTVHRFWHSPDEVTILFGPRPDYVVLIKDDGSFELPTRIFDYNQDARTPKRQRWHEEFWRMTDEWMTYPFPMVPWRP